ncbi:MAG TPA: hydroxymethylbilane synthase [Frankiaceae bacterium]|nr:hydroxymethylbilane synthase [Frankiaceae bacterium]
MSPPAPLRLGTRRSALALAQSELVAAALRGWLGRPVDLVEIVTAGDRSSGPLTRLGGTGVFVTALREALRAGRVDLAVHSLKDLPTAPAPGLLLAAVPPREDPRDALVSPSGRGLAELGPGARVGTGSPRRVAQLHLLGLGLDVVPIRGNVDTRIKKAIDGEVDAVVLARAGLVRLDRLDTVTEVLDPVQMLPAPGQGALAVECWADDPPLAAVLRDALDDPATRAAVGAERACLAALGAGCTAPVGALAEVADDEVHLRAVVAVPDGSDAVRRSATGSSEHPEALGRRLAADLLAAGASTLMGSR